MYGLAKREIQDDNSAIKNLNIPKQLTLKNPFNNIIFNYCSISWNSTSNTKYRYKLDGLETNWNPVTTNKFADYKICPQANIILIYKQCL